jgi:hypothetical protein
LGEIVASLPQEVTFVHNPWHKRTTTHHPLKGTADSGAAPIDGSLRGTRPWSPGPLGYIIEPVGNSS